MAQSGLWSAVASCKDGVVREVLGVYKGEELILISRSWISPANAPIHAINLAQRYHVLCTLMTVADYQCHEGVWYGELSAPWPVLAALLGLSRNAMQEALNSLRDSGYIHYVPSQGRFNPALIRIYPHNQETGDRVLQVAPSWLRGWVEQVEPMALVYTAQTSLRAVEHVRVAPLVSLAELGARIGNAPIYVPDSSIFLHPKPAGSDILPGNLEMINKLKSIPAIEDLSNILLGIDPNHNPNLPAASECKCEGDLSSTWHQDGTKVQVKTKIEVPASDQVGSEVLPAPATCRCGQIERGLLYTYSLDNSIYVATGRYGLPVACAPAEPPAAAPPAPPPVAPPVATAQFMLHRSQRQLQPGQVAAVVTARGERIQDKARNSMTTKVMAFMDTYERLSGVPFCTGDLPHLNRALEITSLAVAFRCLRDCATKWPPENPGYYIVRDGMEHVLKNIISTKDQYLQRKGKKKVAASDSGADPKVMDKRWAARAAKKASGAAPVTPQAPQGSSTASCVSEPSGEKSKEGPVKPS